ncbi:MAG: hypothetical protein NZ693_00130 [Thermoflexales bacterium]|nr:hypothetical protein [Thermoflexales bacterium]
MNLIEDFIIRFLPEVDDLTEAKVTLAALHLLSQKPSAAPFVTEAEVQRHPLVQEGVSFPALSVKPSLQRAVQRGALVCAQVGEQACFFPNTPSGNQAAEQLAGANGDSLTATLRLDLERAVEALRQRVAELELAEDYVPTPAEVELVEEWLADGYVLEELLDRIQTALLDPRPANLPPRTLYHCRQTIESTPPAQPSAFYYFKQGAGAAPLGVIAFRDLVGRLPTGHEYRLLEHAIALFGEPTVIQALKQIVRDGVLRMDELLSRLQEREEAALALQSGYVQADAQIQRAIQYYEAAFGAPPSSAIVEEMRSILQEHNTLDQWPAIFAHARARGKRSWAYIRKLLKDPSSSIFLPEPANEAARFAFDEYRRRVNPKLDPKIAAQINELAQRVSDLARWQAAFDKAAEANALRWDYIRKVVEDEPSAVGKSARGRASRRRLPQVSYTEADREAARQRVDEELAQIDAFFDRKKKSK